MGKNQVHEFWRDLMGTLWGDADTTTTHGIMSAALIADHMSMDATTAEKWLWAAVKYGYTDRQGGGFVV